MRFRLGVISAMLLLALMIGAAWGYPTRFDATTGLVDLPTSDVVALDSAEFAAGYSKLESNQQVWPLRLLVGVSEGAEVGISYAKLNNGVDGSMTGFGAKMTLMEEPTADFGLGFGASYLDGTNSNVIEIYLAASKEFPMGVAEAYRYQAGRARMRGHLGLMFTRVSNGADDDELRPFLGFDITTPEGTSFVAEYKLTDFGDDHAAAAIRYPLSPALTVQVGVARAETVLPQNDYRFIVGFSYDLSAVGQLDRRY
ncbi:MAG: hypothetical protein JSV65_12465 [Armatimonadota bacterium]|nr:MAG: hypothetical protein JSV65_12465 [Armatimonadota bacterium]